MPAAPKPKPKKKTPRKEITRTRIKQINTKRKAKRLVTDFGGKDYVGYITSLPCDVCNVRGHSAPAHLTSRGAGGKAKDLAPLCETRPTNLGNYMLKGCHDKYDDHDPITRSHEPRLRELAAQRHKEFFA